LIIWHCGPLPDDTNLAKTERDLNQADHPFGSLVQQFGFECQPPLISMSDAVTAPVRT
jgi:hypothetical protein